MGKLCAHVRPKCHPLLLDTSINSPATVRLNLFQIMLLAAMKLHCQVCFGTSLLGSILRAYGFTCRFEGIGLAQQRNQTSYITPGV